MMISRPWNSQTARLPLGHHRVAVNDPACWAQGLGLREQQVLRAGRGGAGQDTAVLEPPVMFAQVIARLLSTKTGLDYLSQWWNQGALPGCWTKKSVTDLTKLIK